MLGTLYKMIKQQIVHSWSLDRDPQDINAKLYAYSPVYSLEEMTKAHQWIQKKRNVQVKKIDASLRLNFIASSFASVEITKESVESFMRVCGEQCWENFDELVKLESSIWCIVLVESDWKLGKCSCPYFAKNYNYRSSSSGIAVRLPTHIKKSFKLQVWGPPIFNCLI